MAMLWRGEVRPVRTIETGFIRITPVHAVEHAVVVGLLLLVDLVVEERIVVERS